MNDPFYNLYSIITDSAIKEKFSVSSVSWPNLGDNNPALLREVSSIQNSDSNLDNWMQISKRKIIFHDQEPIAFSQYQKDWRNQAYLYNRLSTNHLLSNSEINSLEKDRLLKETGWKDFYWFSNGFLALEWYRYYQYATYLENHWEPRYQFSCYNRIIKDRSHRTAIARKLLELGKEKIILSYTGESDGEISPIVINTRDYNRENMSYEIVTDDFMNSFCHVVTERLFDEDRIHLTEKIFRPIVCCRPFILASSPHALEYLRSYGFKTFHDFWDESYDHITDHVERLDAITGLIQELSSVDATAMLREMKSILLFNRNHFYNDFRKIIMEEMYHNLQQALNTNDGESYYERIISSLNDDEIDFVRNSSEICSSDDDKAFDVYLGYCQDLIKQSKPAAGIRDHVRANIQYITPFYQALQLKKRDGLVV